MFKSVKKAKSNPKNNIEQAALNPRPLRERVTRTCQVRGNKKQTDGTASRFYAVITGLVPVILVQRVTSLVNKVAILSKDANSMTSRLSSVITGFIPVILVQRVTNLVNKFALVFKRSMLRQDSRDKPENDGCWGRWFSVCCNVFNASALNVILRSKPSVTIKSALILTAFMLFSAAAQARVCFLPDGNCGAVNYGYKTDSTCTYRTSDEANKKKGECEEVKKQGFCYYLSCTMSKSECDKAAAAAEKKCCVPCGNCWKVEDCANPQKTCKEMGYETEQTCKDKNQDFEPNGEFDKNNVACGKCVNSPAHPCSYWNTLSQTYMTESECKTQGGVFHTSDVKDSDNNVCGTCSEEETCQSGYSTAYQSKADCASDETFSSKGKANGKVCGKCEKKNTTDSDDGKITIHFEFVCKGHTCPSDVYDRYKIVNDDTDEFVEKIDQFTYKVSKNSVKENSEEYSGIGPYVDIEGEIYYGKRDTYCKNTGEEVSVENYDTQCSLNTCYGINKLWASTRGYIDLKIYENNDIYMHATEDEYTELYYGACGKQSNDLNACTSKYGGGSASCSEQENKWYECMYNNFPKVENNEVTVKIEFDGNERCAPLDSQKCIYYVVNCPGDNTDCMTKRPYYTITASGNNDKVNKGSHYMQLMSTDELQTKYEETNNSSFRPESNKLVYYTCDLQKWDEGTISSTVNNGYAFSFGNNCWRETGSEQTFVSGPEAEQILEDNVKGYIKITGAASGEDVNASIYIYGELHEDLTLPGGQDVFARYSCGSSNVYSHTAYVSHYNPYVVSKGYYSGSVFYGSGQATDCVNASVNGNGIGGMLLYYSFNSKSGMQISNSLPQTTCDMRDSQGFYYVICSATDINC